MSKVVICVTMNDESQKVLQDKLKGSPFIEGKELLFLHVFKKEIQGYYYPAYLYPNEEQQVEIKQSAEGIMNDLANKIRGNTQNVRTLCLFDYDPKSKVIDTLRDEKPELVITATRGKHGIEGFFSSSFTDHLLKFSPCDVLALRPME